MRCGEQSISMNMEVSSKRDMQPEKDKKKKKRKFSRAFRKFFSFFLPCVSSSSESSESETYKVSEASALKTQKVSETTSSKTNELFMAPGFRTQVLESCAVKTQKVSGAPSSKTYELFVASAFRTQVLESCAVETQKVSEAPSTETCELFVAPVFKTQKVLESCAVETQKVPQTTSTETQKVSASQTIETQNISEVSATETDINSGVMAPPLAKRSHSWPFIMTMSAAPHESTVANVLGGSAMFEVSNSSDSSGESDLLTAKERVNDFGNGQIIPVAQPIIPKYMGFPNIGNTCYMNSILQCLLNVAPIMQDIIFQQECWKNVPGSEMLKALYDLNNTRLCKTTTKQKSQLLKVVRHCIAARNPDFQGNDQQDAHEFLMACLTQLKEEAAMCQKSWQAFKCPTQHLDFKLNRLRTCETCGNQRCSGEDLNCLSLIIGPQKSLMESLQLYFAASSYECRCSKCGAGQTSETVQFQTYPRVLVLLMMRFDFTMNKLKDRLVVPEELNLSSITGSGSSDQTDDLNSQRAKDHETNIAGQGQTTPKRQAVYKLSGVVSHFGDSLYCGHYISNIRDPGAGWLECDDSAVKSISWSKASKTAGKHGYMFFYVRS